MNENLHDNEPFISSGKGWENMERLLDFHLPVKAKKSRQSQVRLLLPSTLLCLIFLFTTFNLSNHFLSPQAYMPAVLKTKNTPVAFFSGHNHTGSSAASIIYTHNRMHQANTRKYINPETNITFQKDEADAKNSTNNYRHNEQLAAGIHIPVKPALLNTFTNENEKIINETIVDNSFVRANNLPVPGDEKNYAKHWDLAMGVAVNNAIIYSKKNLYPYPVAAIRYQVNKHFFVAAGAGIFSPVAKELSGINKNLYVNDTANNILYYHELTTHKHLKYADLPLTAGWQLSNKWSIEAGLQLSILLSKQTSKRTQLVDYQMNSFDRPNSFTTGFATAPDTQVFSAAINKIDYRAITSVNYKLKQVELGVSWQYGLRKPTIEKPVNTGSNHLFTLRALVSLKH